MDRDARELETISFATLRVAWLCSTLCLAACADDGGPRLDTVTPAAAPANAQVTVTGSRLCGVGGDCTQVGAMLQLGLSPPMIDPLVSSYTATTIVFIVPATSPGKTSIEVTVGGRTSNALAFEILP